MRLFPKFQPVATEAERRRRRAMYWAVAVQVVLAIGIVYFATRNSLILVLVCLGLVFVGNMVIAAMVSRVANNMWAARQSLRKAGYRVCPNCSYDLSAGAPEGVCPECGAPYSPDSLRERWEDAYKKMMEKPGR